MSTFCFFLGGAVVPCCRDGRTSFPLRCSPCGLVSCFARGGTKVDSKGGGVQLWFRALPQRLEFGSCLSFDLLISDWFSRGKHVLWGQLYALCLVVPFPLGVLGPQLCDLSTCVGFLFLSGFSSSSFFVAFVPVVSCWFSWNVRKFCLLEFESVGWGRAC